MMINKSLLTASILGAMAAAVSSSAYADTDMTSSFCKPGFYAGVQGGRSDTFYNSSVLSPTENKGLGTKQWQDKFTNNSIFDVKTVTKQTITQRNIDDTGIGGRIYAGYQFDPYFAMELGYTKYANAEASSAGRKTIDYSATQPNVNVKGTAAYNTSYHDDISEHAIDLVAKGTMPLNAGFGLYAKAGMAYIKATQDITADTSGNLGQTPYYYSDGQIVPSLPTSVSHSETHQALRPAAGVGINYTIPSTSMSVVADYSRVFGTGAIKNAGLASLGLEYKFG